MGLFWFGCVKRLWVESLVSFPQAFPAELVQSDSVALPAMSPAALVVTAAISCLFGLLTLLPMLVEASRPAGDE